MFVLCELLVYIMWHGGVKILITTVVPIKSDAIVEAVCLIFAYVIMLF